MTRGGNVLLVTASLLFAGCAGPANNIEIRPVGNAGTQARPASEQIQYARGQLALGNIGLALEAFRKANREEPDNPAALAGLADSYAAMGRHDVARRYYEAALSVVPRDPVLLQAVSQPAPANAADQEAAEVVRGGDTLPIAAPAAQQQVQATGPAPSAAVTARLPAAESWPPSLPGSAQPRLERLSLGEVALVTTTKPMWQAMVVSRTRLSTTVRWVPIRTAVPQPRIRLLNAARQHGLAAHTRQLLSMHGWHKLTIGDAPKVRATSIVLYPAQYQVAGRSLAARLGIRAMAGAKSDTILVLLGRDAVGIRAQQLRG